MRIEVRASGFEAQNLFAVMRKRAWLWLCAFYLVDAQGYDIEE